MPRISQIVRRAFPGAALLLGLAGGAPLDAQVAPNADVARVTAQVAAMSESLARLRSGMPALPASAHRLASAEALASASLMARSLAYARAAISTVPSLPWAAGRSISAGRPVRTVPRPATGPQDSSPDSLYREARAALNRGEHERAARLFGELVEQYPDSEYAADALYWRAFALYRVGGDDNLRQALTALDRQRQRYPNAGTRGDGETLAVRIRGALAQRGDAGAAESVAATADAITQSDSPCEPGEDREIRVAALNALMHMDGERAMPILRQVLARRDDCSAELREKAMFVVSRIDGPESARILVDAARNDPSIDVRKQAVFWLSNVEGEETVDAIADILRSSDSQELREQAVFALSRHDSPRAAELLRKLATDANTTTGTRKQAIFWLSNHESEENAAFLQSLYSRLQEEELRNHVLFSLSRMGGQANHRWLLDRALDEAEPVDLRKQALFWAGRVDGSRVQDLLGLYDSVESNEMKKQLIFVYSRRDEPEAVDMLIEIARGEQNVELRKQAIFWLSRSDDPRAVQVLQEIINP